MSFTIKEIAFELVLGEASEERCQSMSQINKKALKAVYACANVLRQGCACHHPQ